MDQFFKWISTPMDKEDIDTWNRANNIIPEYCDLFEDFSFSLYYLISETYLGFSHGDSNATKIGIMNDDKLEHFRWCFDKVILDVVATSQYLLLVDVSRVKLRFK